MDKVTAEELQPFADRAIAAGQLGLGGTLNLLVACLMVEDEERLNRICLVAEPIGRDLLSELAGLLGGVRP